MVGIGSEVKGHVKREQMGAAAHKGGKMNDRLGDGERSQVCVYMCVCWRGSDGSEN